MWGITLHLLGLLVHALIAKGAAEALYAPRFAQRLEDLTATRVATLETQMAV